MNRPTMNRLITRRRRWQGRPRDAGFASIWLLYISVICLLLSAAFVGGGVVLGARAAGYNLAASAARAGAQQIDLAAYRASGVLRLNPAAAATAARQLLAAAGATGTVTVTPTKITVTATSRQPTPMLRGFGYPAVTVTQTASAAPVRGPT
jgi:hypothetical protein